MLFRVKKLLKILLIVSILGGVVEAKDSAVANLVLQNPATSSPVYLPLIYRPGRAPSIFGVETTWVDSNLLNKAAGIQTYWWRYSAFLWNSIEPSDVDPAQYNWNAVDEAELAAMVQQGSTVVAVVKNTPLFAQTINDPRNIPCSPIKDDQATINEFVEFVHELAVRYSGPPYNIKYWQLGNEPDVDPVSLPGGLYTSNYGCWGNLSDAYFGGEYFAQFLKIFSETIKSVNPSAKITNGGLLLDCHPDNYPNCTSGMFFEGIIKYLSNNNALNSLDYASFHVYNRWYQDLRWDENWKGFEGGMLLGKSLLLRQVMAKYQISPPKPLLVTEVGVQCSNATSCTNPVPPANFSDDQAEYVVWTYVRSIADGISGVMWYTLNYQDFKHVGLLNSDGSPKPAYTAYQFLVSQLGNAKYVGKLDIYFPTLRAYEFTRNSQRVWVLWAPDQINHAIPIPAGFNSAYDYLGVQVVIPSGATDITINGPVYLILD